MSLGIKVTSEIVIASINILSLYLFCSTQFSRLQSIFQVYLTPLSISTLDEYGWSGSWNENWQGKPKYSKKTCISATLNATNSTWTDLGSKPATDRVSHGTAKPLQNYERKRANSIKFALHVLNNYSDLFNINIHNYYSTTCCKIFS
jgi:hypothetical protein